MALEPQDIRKLFSLRQSRPGGQSGLILGDCAFLFSKSYLADLSGNQALVRSEEAATVADVAQALGFTRLDTIDLFGSPTIRFDLQSPCVPAELRQQYDWIIDAGTVFCCFNVSRVLQNVLDMLRPAGTVFHLAGLAGYLGRSYYSLSPMLFADFYLQNGFEIVEMGVRVKPRHAGVSRWLFNRRRDRVDREWRRIGVRDHFVAKADAENLTFREHHGSDETDVLPNNALIMCVATRQQALPFKDAIPGYYAR